jgi:endonuclease/exonuclease/phosphatase family metal-dependent hydrolase
MHWKGALLLLAVACSGAPLPGTVSGPTEMVDVRDLSPLSGRCIVSYNVENLFDVHDDPATNDDDFTPQGKLQWTIDRYTTKLERLAEAIGWSADGPPAIVGLVEVENRTVVDDLARTGVLKPVGYQVVHHESPDERGIDVALLVDPRYGKVLRHEPLSVPLDRDRTRDVLYVEIALTGDERLHVFVNHWPSRRDGARSVPKRMTAARVVREAVDEVLRADPDAQVLIMGDYNDTPLHRSVQEGLGAACDATADASLFALMCMGQPSGNGSYNYQGEWSYLDQMVVSRALLAKVAEAKAYWDERLQFRHPRNGRSPDKTYAGDDYKGGYSDHLPIYLRLK